MQSVNLLALRHALVLEATAIAALTSRPVMPSPSVSPTPAATAPGMIQA